MLKAPEGEIRGKDMEMTSDGLGCEKTRERTKMNDEKFLDAAVRTEKSCQQRMCLSLTLTTPREGAHCLSLLPTHIHSRPTL